MLAKRNKYAFVDVIDRAKYLANSGMLRIVFVSSEGSVLPLVNTTSSSSRTAPVLEFVDISDEQAEKYLGFSLPKDLAKSVVALTGGRFIHLISAIEVFRRLEKEECDPAKAVNIIREYLISRNVKNRMMKVLEQEKPFRALEKSIMDIVVSKGSVDSEELSNNLPLKSSDVARAVNHLVSLNFLRYEANGNVAVHSRLVRWCMENNKVLFAV